MTNPIKLSLAIQSATAAHMRQVDKSGEPYILHPLRVMLAVPDDIDLQCVAVLHDVVEDSPFTLDDIRREFGDVIADGVDGMTKREGETYEAFIARAMTNPLSNVVKRYDILDNVKPNRLNKLDYATRRRLMTKYTAAWYQMVGMKL